jgi:hypothetical protein
MDVMEKLPQSWLMLGLSLILAVALLFGALSLWTLYIYVTSPKGPKRRRRRRPIRNEKRDAKRRAWEYARQVTGNPRLSWKSAKKRLEKWEREGRLRGVLTDESRAAIAAPEPEPEQATIT